MALDLSPKDAPKDAAKDDETAKPKARATSSTTALQTQVSRLEKLVNLLADDRWGKNVRPALPDDENEV